MTLRHRLLLVYLVVVLLSVATAGVAVFELNRARGIYGALQQWHEIVLTTQKLRAAFPPAESAPSQPTAGLLDRLRLMLAFPPAEIRPVSRASAAETEFRDLMAQLSRNFTGAGDYPNSPNLEQARELYYTLYDKYRTWQDLTPQARGPQTKAVDQALNDITAIVDDSLKELNHQAERQSTRQWLLLLLVGGLTIVHVMVVGWLLRRWLLMPMERLNRQVDALAHDRPPPEPLLSSPLEMANLAAALDRARVSLGALRQQLIDTERLTTVGQFAAQLAHNLRNPLASIRAVAQLTARQSRDNPIVRGRMDEVITSVDRLNHWIGGLMEIARREATPAYPGDIVPVLERIRVGLAPEVAAKELSLSLEAPAGGLRCMHDPVTLEQALIAMVVNAIEASPLGGRIVLRAELIGSAASPPAQPNGSSTSSSTDAGPVCRISVIDAGPGLPSSSPDQIFEFAYSTKQRGMGLGLALARLALQRQGGRTHAHNAPTGGAVVCIDLPLAPEDPAPMSRQMQTQAAER